jgi:hypothetical protein
MPRYAYQRNGAPLLSWRGGTAPQGTRAADCKALGSLSEPTLELPRAGAPEPLPALAGCECKGTTSGLIGQPMGDAFSLALPWGGHMQGQYVQAAPLSGIVDTVRALPLVAKIAGAVGLYFLWKKLTKKKYKSNPARRRKRYKRKRRPIRRTRRGRRRHSRYSSGAKKFIAKRMAAFERGKMKSRSRRVVRNRRQAIAIALSEARKKGYKVPRKR